MADCHQLMAFGSGSCRSGRTAYSRSLRGRVERLVGHERAVHAARLAEDELVRAAVQVAADGDDPARLGHREHARAAVLLAPAARHRPLRVGRAGDDREPVRLDGDDGPRVDRDARLDEELLRARPVVHDHDRPVPLVGRVARVAVAGRERQRPQLLARAVEALARGLHRAHRVRPPVVRPAVGVDEVVEHRHVLRDDRAVGVHEPHVHPDDRARDLRRRDLHGVEQRRVRAELERARPLDVGRQRGVRLVLGHGRGDLRVRRGRQGEQQRHDCEEPDHLRRQSTRWGGRASTHGLGDLATAAGGKAVVAVAAKDRIWAVPFDGSAFGAPEDVSGPEQEPHQPSVAFSGEIAYLAWQSTPTPRRNRAAPAIACRHAEACAGGGRPVGVPGGRPGAAWPEGSIGEQPLTKSSGCLSWPAPPGRAGLCADAPAPDLAKIPPVSVAPGSTLAVRFDQPVSNISSGQGALTQVDANTWTFALPASAVGSQLVGLHAQFPGPDVTGSAMFFAHLAVTSQTVSDLRRTGSVVRARVRVPAQARSAPTCASTASAAPPSSRGRSPRRASGACGSTVRRPGTAWLVTQYTFPGAKPVEVSQRLSS